VIARLTLHFTLEDSNRKRAEIRLNLREDTTFSQVGQWVASMEAALSLLSDCAIVKAEAKYSFALFGQQEASSTSDCSLVLYVFLGNDTESASITVFSPRILPVDLVGPYRGFRLAMEAFQLPGVQSALGVITSNSFTPIGNSWIAANYIGSYNRENPS